MAWQEGRVQLAQSDMRLAFNIAKMAKGGLSRAAIEETQYLIKKPPAQVWEEMKSGIQFPGERKVKAAIEWHLALVYENHTDGCLLCKNGTAMNPWTCWRRWGMSASPQVRRKQPKQELRPPPPGTPPAPPGEYNGPQSSIIANFPTGYAYKHTALPRAQFFNSDTDAEDSEHDQDVVSDLRNIEGTSTG